MFTAYAMKTGWNVYRDGKAELIATFEKLGTVKDTVEKMGGTLTVVIGGLAL